MKTYKVPWEIHLTERNVEKGTDVVQANDHQEALRIVHERRLRDLPPNAYGWVGK